MCGISLRRLSACGFIALAAACLLCGYEFIRSASQSLFIGAYGRERLPLVMALAPAGAFAFVYIYGVALSRVGARRAMVLTCLGSAGLMVICFGGIVNGWRVATAVLYVVRESYIVLLVEQIWSFIDSTVGTADGRKLNGLICGVASFGAILGGLMVARLPQGLSSVHLLVVAAASVVPTGIFTLFSYRVGGEPRPEQNRGVRCGHLGLRLFVVEPLLRRLAMLVVVSQAISTVADLAMNFQVAAAIPDVDERTRWFGSFYARLNGWSALFQFVVTPILLNVAPLRAVHVGIPVVHLATGLWLAFRPSLAAAAVGYMAFKVLDYSVFRAAKEVLYIPLSFDARYRTKEMIDSFGYRLSKGGLSALLAVVGAVVSLPFVLYAVAQIVGAAGWIFIAGGVSDRRPREP